MAYKGKKDPDRNLAYDRLREDMRSGNLKSAYIFYGEERYLLDDAVRRLREMIPAETAEFNHHRLDGRGFSLDAFLEAVDALPVFAERTLVEVKDPDFTKMGEEARQGIISALSDAPDYSTVVFVCGEELKLDGRTKSGQELKKLAETVEFARQDDSRLVTWVTRRLAASGKSIPRDAAERFILLTGGLMTNMTTELEKLITYTKGDAVGMREVELLVTPVADARIWSFTDAIIKRQPDLAFEKMDELLRTPGMDEYGVLYGLANVTRQLMTAKICVKNGVGVKEFMSLSGVKSEYPAKNLMAASGKYDLSRCAAACEISCQTLLRLNSSSDDPRGAAKELTARVLIALGAS